MCGRDFVSVSVCEFALPSDYAACLSDSVALRVCGCVSVYLCVFVLVCFLVPGCARTSKPPSTRTRQA